MKDVPLELDSIMWRLAEEANPAARAEFETRHPRYGPELARRVKMVADLRSAGKTVVNRPTFTPRPTQVAAMPRGLVWAVAGLGALAVGAVAFVASSGGEAPRPSTSGTVVRLPSPPTSVPTPEPRSPVPPAPRILPPVHEQLPPLGGTPPTSVSRGSGKTSIRIEDKPLTVAIGLVARAGNLDVTVAPGFQNRNVTLDYPDMTPLEILRTMGEEYDFSVIEESEDQYLLIPVRERSSGRRIGT